MYFSDARIAQGSIERHQISRGRRACWAGQTSIPDADRVNLDRFSATLLNFATQARKFWGFEPLLMSSILPFVEPFGGFSVL
jgi:hypothetical protein